MTEDTKFSIVRAPSCQIIAHWSLLIKWDAQLTGQLSNLLVKVKRRRNATGINGSSDKFIDGLEDFSLLFCRKQL